MIKSARARLGASALCFLLGLAAPLQATARTGDADSERAAARRGDAPPASRGDGARDTSGEPQRHRKPKDRDIPWWLVVVPVVACAAADCLGGRDKPGPASGPSRRDLLENGPRPSMTRPIGAFPVYGFIRNGWPIVVDYSSRPDSVTWLTVSVEGRPAWSARLQSGDHYAELRYNGGDAQGSKVALIAVQSQAPSASGSGEPLPLEVRGIGAGPRAVGSVAINQLAFALSRRQLGGDFAHFGYVAEGDFNKVNTEILRFTADRRNGRQVIDAALVAEYRQGAVPSGRFGPRMWDGLDSRTHRPSRGSHRLQVRGWEVEDDESWVSAISDMDVQVP